MYAIRSYYGIDEESESDITNRRLEALDTFHALKVGKDTSKIIHFEKRHPQGSEYLMPLIQAIKREARVQFTYQKFWDNFFTVRTVEPRITSYNVCYTKLLRRRVDIGLCGDGP